MVEFFCKAHPEPGEDDPDDVPGGDGFCRFEKRMKKGHVAPPISEKFLAMSVPRMKPPIFLYTHSK